MFTEIKELESEIKNNEITLDKDIAIAYLGNSNEAYKVMIINYLQQYSNVTLQLEKFYQNFQYDEIKNLIHKIKGIAMYIGSPLFYKYADYLNDKYKLNKFDDMEYELHLFKKYNELVINKLNNIKEEIK